MGGGGWFYEFMEASAVNLKVWTEGLGEFWGITPQKDRRQRDDMTPEAIVDVIHTIIEENSHDANGLFILESGGRRLNLNLSNGVVEVSDPRNANYQNVAIAESELAAYLNSFFVKEVETQKENLRTPLVQKLEYLVAVIVVVALGLSIRFVMQFMEDNSQFMPEPQTADIADMKELRSLTIQYAGVYATNMREGEMVIELKEDGTWFYYDMQSGSLGSYILEPVKAGSFRPVYESGRLAILTDARYVFYPDSENGRITFLQRPFKRIGNSRDDLPYLSFPEKVAGALARK